MEELVLRLCRALGREPSPRELAGLASYCELVRAWNARIDLTAARDDEPLVEVLCGDAVVLARPDVVPADARLVDVGSGAGAPAIPLALLREDLTVTMVEPLRKRVAFLRTAIGSLDLAGRVSVLEMRAEPGAKIPGAPFDVAVSRATFAPGEWLELGASLAERVIVLTAREPPPAVADGWGSSSVEYALPFGRAPRAVTVYRPL